MSENFLKYGRLAIYITVSSLSVFALVGCTSGYGQKFQELGTIKEGTFQEKELSEGVYFCQGEFSDLNGTVQALSLLTIDTDKAEVCLGYIKGERHPVSSLAKQYDAIAAVNGGYFKYTTPVTPSGFFKANSTIVNANPANEVADCGYLYIDPPSFYGIWTPEELQVDRYRNVFWSYPILLLDGKVSRRMGDFSHVASRHARTAFGITSSQQILLLVVDKGHAVNSADRVPEGMTCLELANVMKKLDASEAINLDGGGSSTMYIRGEDAPVNVPSESVDANVKKERPVYSILYVVSRQ